VTPLVHPSDQLAQGGRQPRHRGTGDETCSVEVRSPVTPRRQAEIFGAFHTEAGFEEPHLATCGRTYPSRYTPPWKKGETRSMGTRNPNPMGPS